MRVNNNRITIREKLTNEDAGKYVRIPFNVGLDIQRLVITYHIDEEKGNAIDFGIDDIKGYRGWSNTRKNRIVLSENYATTGYKKGDIMAGLWHMIIGVFQVEKTCSVHIDIEMIPEEPTWYAGDLHMHSVHSDGAFQVTEVIACAKEAGLDYIALTDHNTFTQNDVIVDREDMVIIPGVELTTYKGHANCWGIKQPFSHFIYTDGDDEQQVMSYLREAEDAGALVSMNHPFHKDPWQWDKYTYEFQFVEVINAYEAASGNRQAITWWHNELCKGRRIVAVGGSDVHRKEPVKWYGIPTTWVQSRSMDQSGILTGLQDGKVCITTSTDTPIINIYIEDTEMGGTYKVEKGEAYQKEQLVLTCEVSHGMDGIMVIMASSGCYSEVTLVKDIEMYQVPIDTKVLFYRVEVYTSDKTKLLAVTNPIYLQHV